jgi:hypothetical protein
MRLLSFGLPVLLACLPAMASAQLDAPVRTPSDDALVVTGKRLTRDGKPIPMSEWRVAETDHVVYYARAGDKEVARIARNLERLHFLLSILLNRVGRQDDTLKLNVIQVGDSADFRQLRLGHARWQEGPFPNAFPPELYYDPRDDGAVLATTHTDQNIILQPGRDLSSIGVPAPAEIAPGVNGPGMTNPMASANGAVLPVKVNEVALSVRAEGRLYSGFAQHYLMTYFPAAYPRWYLDGFGQMFTTLAADQDGTIEYGRLPEGFGKVIEEYGSYRIADLISGRYLTEKKSQTDWTPYHAWSLVHLLFFSEEWKKPLHDYLAAVARGEDPAEAGKALGDLAGLQRQWAAYRGRKVPFERLTYPAGRFGDPLVRQLTRDQADYMKRRLVLGARIAIAAPSPGKEAERAQALDDRNRWLEALGRDAQDAQGRLDLQLLWAEAACRSQAYGDCLKAADRSLVLAPNNASGLAWKGMALAGQAAALPAAQQKAQLATARSAIARANKADTEATLPLLAYYRSFREVGAAPPDLAILGLTKAVNSVPAASESRLLLGEALARRGNGAEARQILLPLARGPYDTPERPEAERILARIAPTP